MDGSIGDTTGVESADVDAPSEPVNVEFDVDGSDHVDDQGSAGFVVAVGASAGGLEALEGFFTNCADDSGAAFVVIQHFSPDHKSIMGELLGRYTKMPIRMASDGLSVEGNTVYLIPPGTVLRLTDGLFQLSPSGAQHLTMPIDVFLGSLARDRGPRSIGVILSGTGSDGTRGAAEINAAGGILLAQQPEDAKFDGMPLSAIGTGLVDVVAPATELPERVLSYVHPTAPGDRPTRHAPLGEVVSVEDAREGILDLLLQASGIDFHDYKPSTLIRRIERRMQVRHVGTFEHYREVLGHDHDELANLRRELLIPVTSFFRDADAFETLADEAVEAIVATADLTRGIRVWVAGVSTGEEAYSIAMLFLEAFDRVGRWPPLKVFATDVNQQNIDVASAGIYPESAAAEMTRARLERFFVRSGSSWMVAPTLRQCLVFACHNLLADPPFTRMDLVSCRNTLIYFTQNAQQNALRRLKYATVENGFLFLGPSESLADEANSFAVVHARHKLFRRIPGQTTAGFTGGEVVLGGLSVVRGRYRRERPAHDDEAQVVDDAMTSLMNDFVPPSMLVNERHEVVHLFGDLTPYFRPREGSASLQLNRILPDVLVPVASALLFKASKEGEPIVSDLVRVRVESGPGQLVRLRVRPLRPDGDRRSMLVSFSREADEVATSPSPVDVGAETLERVEILERQLEATRESLQATIEELEAANEELQATNEELMASNEELQSSNEGLKSLNEELSAVNAEFQEKVSSLNRSNADLDSMAKAAGIATVFVDANTNLTRFSSDAVHVFKVRDGDIGRPLDEITHLLDYPDLVADVRWAMRTERTIDREVVAQDGRVFLARILPYRLPSSLDNGAVATFIDTTTFSDRQRLRDLVDVLPERAAVLGPDGTVKGVNAAWESFGTTGGDAEPPVVRVGSNALDTPGGLGVTDDESVARAVSGARSVLDGNLAAFSLLHSGGTPDDPRWFVMTVMPIHAPTPGVVVRHLDITAWRMTSQAGEGSSDG